MAAGIGMSVPGSTDISSLGSDLTQQVANETDEERRKRLLALNQNKLLPNTAPGASALGLTTAGYGTGMAG